MQNKPRLTSLSLAVVATTLLLGSTSALAANYKDEYKDVAPVVMPACVQLMDGFYVGAQVGYDNYSTRETTSVAPALSLGGTINGNPSVAANGWVGGLFLGYGMYFSNLYYLGLEVFGNGSGASESHNFTASNGDSYNNKFTVGGSYGISLLPGIKLSNATLGYIRLGYNRASMKGQETSTPAGTGGTYDSKSQWQGGFNYGLGMETYVYQNFSVRTEYTHTNYSSFSNTYTKYSPSDNQFMLGLIYHFA
jgi:outer membrane immunogenic protein